jgi:hypothetical protein
MTRREQNPTQRLWRAMGREKRAARNERRNEGCQGKQLGEKEPSRLVGMDEKKHAESRGRLKFRGRGRAEVRTGPGMGEEAKASWWGLGDEVVLG